MDINLFYFIIIVWIVSGYAVIIHELRHDTDIDLSILLMAMLVSVLGPLWLIKTFCRKMPKVILKKYDTSPVKNEKVVSTLHD